MLTCKVVLFFCVSSLLCSCNNTSSRDVLTTTPEFPVHWAAADKSQHNNPLGQWLATFNDAELSGLVTEALQTNYDLKVAAARVKAANEQALIAGASGLPQLNLSPAYQAGKYPQTPQSSIFDGRFNLSWELDVWGRIRTSQQGAEQDAEATAADFQAARLSLAARTTQSYFELLEANLQVKVAEQSIRDRQTIVELVRGRFTRGLTDGLDLRLVLTDLANAQAQLAAAQNQAQLISRRLEVLLGRYPSGLLQKNKDLPMPPATLSAGLPAQLLTRRPDLIAAFARLKGSDSRLESAEKALLPRITLTASGGASSKDLVDLIDPRAAAWNVMMGLMQPIFMGGRLQAEIQFNQALVEENLHQYKSAALNAFQEVEQTLAAEHWLRAQEQALKQAVEQTQASRQLAVYSYRQGLIQILTLLDSYRSTLNAQSQYLTARRQLLTNRINLYLALGGDI